MFVAVADLSRRHNVRAAFDSVFREFGGATVDVMLIGCGRANLLDDVDGGCSPAMNEVVKANVDAAASETSTLVS